MNEFRFILKRISRHKWFMAAALLLTAAQCLLKLMLPRMMGDIINTGLFTGDTGKVAGLGWKMLLVCILMGLFGYGANLLCAYIGQRFALDLRCELYRKISGLSVQQVSSFGSGSLITRLSGDTDTCAGFVFAVILLVTEPLLIMTGGIIMMWRIEALLGIFFVVFTVLQLLVMLFFIRRTTPGFMAVRKMVDHMNNHLQNFFSAFRLMKSSGTETDETQKFSETNRAVFDKAYAVQMKIAIFNPMIMLIMESAVACILYISGVKISEGSVSVGAMLSAINYAEQVLISIVAGGRIFRILAETQPSAARIIEVLETEPDIRDGESAAEAVFRDLRMEKVCFAYNDGTRVFDGLDLEIHAGEMLAVVGSIGSGKTTLAGLCARLFDPAAGRILLNGTDIRSLKLEDVRRLAALVEKQSAVLEGTLRENIVFGRENISEESITRALSTAQMGDYLEKHPEGLDTYLVSMGKSLSGGEKQRLTIARALAGEPGLLVLDDSTSSLDYETEKNLFAALRENYPDMAILLTTNRLPSALRADRILVLDKNGKTDEGSDSELRQRCELYRRMCMAQDMRA